GATTDYRGRFLQANRGTLLLDEIVELPLNIQAKLLRVLDEQVIYRLKSEKGQKIDIRLIASTNKNLENEVKLKNFRSDLFYRLKESMIILPPLRERIEDILPLTHHYIGLFNTLYGKAIEGISKEVEYYFLNATWPGNVRELKNFIKGVLPFTKNNIIEMDDLSYSAIRQEKTGEDRILTYEEYKKNYIIKVLQITDFNISRAAKLLSMSRPSLYRKIKEFNIKKEGPGSID
ncbi:MAG: sigma-54-dependent Fis family transcriptional regulator, partial [Candidatus Aminicenantes bacterium]|nr:sigma-54-dependent Fis family transcriptional regulator [Candidatus Aminicenantes bacterium]